MKRYAMVALALCLAWLPGSVSYAAASLKSGDASEAVFIQVTGKVTMKSGPGKRVREAQVGSKAKQGWIIMVDKEASAKVQFFDNSTLELKPQTQLILNTLKRTKAKDKNLKFTLSFGGILAKVTKLMTPNSSFEIGAGGVVCGVRGTEFSEDYNPDSNNLLVDVLDGSILTTDLNGQENLLTGGQQMNFTNGLSTVPPQGGDQSGGAPPPGGSGSGEGGSIALGDLNGQFQTGLGLNNDNANTDPAVGGTVHLNVHLNVSPAETAP